MGIIDISGQVSTLKATQDKIVVELEDTSLVSDGYHTFGELYEHRCLLFLALMATTDEDTWAAKFHADGSELVGWFIAGINLPNGAITYHLPDRMWKLLPHLSQKMERAPGWDGHTSQDVLDRLKDWLSVARTPDQI